jgi:opacity protein-like surface antigen
MTKFLTIAALAIAVLLPNAPAFAQRQGSNQAADYALSWGAARGGYGAYGGAYARYGYGRYHRRRDWR